MLISYKNIKNDDVIKNDIIIKGLKTADIKKELNMFDIIKIVDMKKMCLWPRGKGIGLPPRTGGFNSRETL